MNVPENMLVKPNTTNCQNRGLLLCAVILGTNSVCTNYVAFAWSRRAAGTPVITG